MRMLTRAALAAALLTVTGGLAVACSEDNPLDNAATCPGTTCTAALQDLVDDIAAVDGVHGVTRAHREHVVGKPERVVDVTAAPSDDAAGEALANDVADVIEASAIAPEQLPVIVTWQPAELVDHPVDFTSHQAPPDGSCADAGCSSELAGLVADLQTRYPDASGVKATLSGGRVDVTGRWVGAGDAPVVEVTDLVHESSVRGYDTTVVSLVERAPHQVEVRRGGW